jgi:CubicO group peptidase (beta-lactamase class C family)
VAVAEIMPGILKERLTALPGAVYQYSNAGYLLLGQAIQAISGNVYEQECARRVLIPAGIKAPTLDREWGKLVHSAGGWSLSGPDYLGFVRILRSHAILPGQMRKWMQTPQAKWVEEGERAYTLGVRFRMLRDGKFDLYHHGDWTWNQEDAVGGPRFGSGSYFVSAADGVAWFASFDGAPPDTQSRNHREIDEAMWRARRAVVSWPNADLFATMGVGPVASRPR